MFSIQPRPELESALRRAFVDKHANYIVITSRRERFQIAAANHGMDQGWLSGHWDDSDEQSTAFICWLTDKGREHFGLGLV